jgi:hypothetical protein
VSWRASPFALLARRPLACASDVAAGALCAQLIHAQHLSLSFRLSSIKRQHAGAHNAKLFNCRR